MDDLARKPLWNLRMETAGCRDPLVDDISVIHAWHGQDHIYLDGLHLGRYKPFFENPDIRKNVLDGKLFYKKLKSLWAIETEGIQCGTLAGKLLGETLINPDSVAMKINAAGQARTWALENAVLPAIGDMELGGTFIDQEIWCAALAVQEDAAANAKRHLDNVAREYFETDDEGRININYQATRNVLQLLRHLRVTVPVIKPGGEEVWESPASTNKETLQAIASDPVIRNLLKYRSSKMLISTFGRSYLEAVNPVTGRLHFEVDQLGASTGRCSSAPGSPVNMLNIPKKGLYRAAFHGGAGTVCERHDYAGFELRIWAELSGDPFLREAYLRGVDVHSFIATKLFQREVSKTENDHLRAIVKELNFGVAYGMSPVTFYMKLRGLGLTCTYPNACQFYDEFCRTLRVGMNFLRDAGRTALRTGKLTNVSGRTRVWPTRGRTQQEDRSVVREGMNFLIQSVGADIIKRAMIAVRDYQRKEHVPTQIFNQVYDELDTYTAASHSASFAPVKTRLMVEAAASIIKSVPVVVDCTIGPSWGTITSSQ